MEFERYLEEFQTFGDLVKDTCVVIITKQRAYFLQQLHRDADLERFGIVQKLWYEHHGRYHFAIVQLQDVASAENLVRQGTIVLCGIDFIVRPYCSVHELYATIRHRKLEYPSMRPSYDARNGSSIHHKLLPSSKYTNENILTHLNDYCLREIFLQLEDICDLSTVMAVCSRFKEVGKEAVTSLWKRKTIDFSELNPCGRVSIMEIEKFVSRLGFAVVSVMLNELHFPNMTDVTNSILVLLQRHCPNLKSLTIYKYGNFAQLQSQTIVEVRPLLSKLSFVEIRYRQSFAANNLQHRIEGEYSPSRTNNLFVFISSLKEVETLIIDVKFPAILLPIINFEKLKVFKSNAYYRMCRQFLLLNQQIEELDIVWQPELGDLFHDQFRTIPKLFLRRVGRNDDLRQLKNLEEINITLQWETLNLDTIVIYGIKNICHLQIMTHQIFDVTIIGAIKQLPNLKSLEIIYLNQSPDELFMSNVMLCDLLRGATKLEEFTMSLPFPQIYELQVQDCHEILSIVESRPHPQKLHVIFESRTQNLDQELGMKTSKLKMDAQGLMMTKRFPYKSFYEEGHAGMTFMNKPLKPMRF